MILQNESVFKVRLKALSVQLGEYFLADVF
jgi:hypothetical protein